ncbi:MAG: hypothetical protein JRN37_04095 [Nitrososphaerota archaeon]|jgi:hypothetical protein|nr:hypothetical protein [Nitrososphaerota archaeon]
MISTPDAYILPRNNGLFQRTKYADFYFTQDGFIEVSRRVAGANGDYNMYQATVPLSVKDKDFSWLPVMVAEGGLDDIPKAELISAIYDIELNFELLRQKWRRMGRPSRSRYDPSRVKALADLFKEESEK